MSSLKPQKVSEIHLVILFSHFSEEIFIDFESTSAHTRIEVSNSAAIHGKVLKAGLHAHGCHGGHATHGRHGPHLHSHTWHAHAGHAAT